MKATEREPRSVVMLADDKEGKAGTIAKAVPGKRAAELIEARKGRQATPQDFDFAGV